MLKLIVLISIARLGLAQEVETPKEKPITFLDLSNRSITNLEDYNFTALTELESIDLSYNDITFIHDDQFRKNMKLKSINLSGNPHLKMPQYSTLLIASIEHLNLSHCYIEEVFESSFDGLLNLKSIDLSFNPIEKHGISYYALTTLTDLREIAVSQTDKPLITEICNEVDLTIIIRSEHKDNIDIKCEDVREGKLDEILAAAGRVASVETETGDEQKGNAPVTAPANVSPKVEDIQTTVKVEDKTVFEVIIPIGQEETKPKEEAEAGEVAVPLLVSTKTLMERVNKDDNPPEIDISKVAVEIPKNESEVPKNETVAKDEPLQGPINEVSKNDENSKTDGDNSKAAKTMIGQQADKDGEGKVQASESSQPAAGTTVLVILVIAAVVAGIAAFGYKYYKSSKDDEDEPVEKELQEIAAHPKINGVSIEVENEPLIHERKCSIEIKEVDESVEEQNKNRSSQNGSSYIPITSVERVTVTEEEIDINRAPK